MTSSSGRKEKRAEESGAELDRGNKRVGVGKMFDLMDKWKEFTDSIKKLGDGELWQHTTDWRKRGDEETTARS